jgi:hypothetical protein
MSDFQNDPGEKYFNCSDRERAAFEAGIKLGTIYHQFVGAPVSEINVKVLEKAIEDGAKIQPFVEDVKVKIDRNKLRGKKDHYDYVTLLGNMLDVKMMIRYKDKTVFSELRYVEELDYPLMYITKIQ